MGSARASRAAFGASPNASGTLSRLQAASPIKSCRPQLQPLEFSLTRMLLGRSPLSTIALAALPASAPPSSPPPLPPPPAITVVLIDTSRYHAFVREYYANIIS